MMESEKGNPSVCRCCLSVGDCKELSAEYTWLNETATYADMLIECFDVGISLQRNGPNGPARFICEDCIMRLRDAYEFKKKIISSENKFINMIESGECTAKKLLCFTFKEEIPVECDSNVEYLEDEIEFLEDDGELLKNIISVKKEHTSSSPKLSTNADNDKINKKIKTDVENNHGEFHSEDNMSKLQQLLSRQDLTIKKTKKSNARGSKTKKSNRDLNLEHSGIICKKVPGNHSCVKSGKTKRKETTISNHSKNLSKSIKNKNNDKKEDISQHIKADIIDNLQTILECSNAVPFKNKSFRGYTCCYCEHDFSDFFQLRHHTEQEHKRESLNILKKFNMNILKKFNPSDTTIDLDTHNLKCTICQENMSGLKALKQHLVRTHNKKFNDSIKDYILEFRLTKADKYDCALCPCSYETLKMLKQHMAVHYNNFVCERCGKPFITYRSLHYHEGTHTQGSFKCKHCDKVFTTNVNRRYHENFVHKRPKSTGLRKCLHCDETFKHYYNRNQHMIRAHNVEYLYKCSVCEKGFFLKNFLNNHFKRYHLKIRNLKCTQCDGVFFRKSDLTEHMHKHFDEKRFSCDVCEKSYKSRKSLSFHKRSHDGDSRYQCEVCSKTFTQKCSLKNHMMSFH